MFSMLIEISVVPLDRQMGQTHPEQHGSLARTYVSTILFGKRNSFVEDRYCCSSLYLLISDTEGQEKQTQSSKWGQICNWVPPGTSSFYVPIGLFCWLKPLLVCRCESDNCDLQFVKVKESLNWWSHWFSIPVWSELTWSWWRFKTLAFLSQQWIQMQTIALSLTYCSLLFLSQTRGIQFLESRLHHHYVFPPFQFQYNVSLEP